MKTIIQTLTILSAVLLVSCTSNEGALKEKAVEDAKAQFAVVIEKEAADNLTQSEFLKNAYVSFIMKFSEFSAEEVKMQGENSGVTTVYLTSYSPAARKQLLKVAATVSDSAARNFNFANALKLIAGQTGISAEPIKLPFAVLTLKKGVNKEWSIIK